MFEDFGSFSRKELKVILTGALTFITALAWNKFFEQLISENPKFKKFGLAIYAVSVTVFFILLMYGWKKFDDFNLDETKNSTLFFF